MSLDYTTRDNTFVAVKISLYLFLYLFFILLDRDGLAANIINCFLDRVSYTLACYYAKMSGFGITDDNLCIFQHASKLREKCQDLLLEMTFLIFK